MEVCVECNQVYRLSQRGFTYIWLKLIAGACFVIRSYGFRFGPNLIHGRWNTACKTYPQNRFSDLNFEKYGF